MKLRLEVTVAPGQSSSFVHEGPVIRIGRSPEAQLVIEGPASSSVSWEHAEIKLTPFGALLNDLHSTNGTLVNDKRVSEQVLLKFGDLIQLGNTGPVLRVMDLDLSPPKEPERVPRPEPAVPVKSPPAAREARAIAEPVPERVVSKASGVDAKGRVVPPPVPVAAQRLQRVLLVAMCVIGVCALSVLAVLVSKIRGLSEPTTPEAPGALAPRADSSQPGPKTSSPTKASADASDIGKDQAVVKPGASVPGKAEGLATRETPPPPADKQHQAVGISESWAKAPNILLQRESELFPWARVRPSERVVTETSLLCLPGYRSSILLDSGVRLVLWGNVPEFGAFPPLLESVVTLHSPGPEADAEFTLDRGRVVLSLNKPNAQARIRIRFRREAWDLILGDPKTEVAVELWSLYPGDVPFGKDPVACLGLFVKGHARLRARERDVDLPNSSQVTWANTTGNLVGPETLPALPRWWTSQLSSQSPAAGEQADTSHMIIALNDLAKEIDKQDAVIDTVITLTREAGYVQLRVLGVLCLGALENISRVVDALDDRQFADVRAAAAYVLRTWLSRNADYAAELRRILSTEKGYAKPKVETIMGLLHDFSAQELDDPKTYARLIDLLNHDNLSIRDLASWHLYQLVPEAKMSIPYDPAANADERQRVVEQWKKMVAEGKVPPRKGGARRGAR